ncbi:MAG TPA: AraC family transcriptional regulator [Minicystis sp.]|nr:AraC family transcriptional regulator [Minicystis sp.]
MLLSHRTVVLPEAGARLATHAVIHEGFRVLAVERLHVISEDELLVRGFARRGALGRPIATVLLEGRGRLRAPGEERWIARGERSIAATKTGLLMRQEAPRYRSVVCEWEPGRWGERPAPSLDVARVDDAHLARLAAFADALAAADRDPSTVADELEAAWAALRELGVPLAPFARTAAFAEAVSESTLRVAEALDELQSNLKGAPMMVDLERATGLSARQLQRLVHDFNARYGFNASTWRDTRNRWRLLAGATLMTAPGATAEAVARAVGFGSVSTFARALADVGLPPPTEIADVVRALA